ncbi:MAG: zinc ribbon domain-containing protein [Clostridia bacterium]|nr:zinc ribbon domain-containing protein [Clostridia bacterium]
MFCSKCGTQLSDNAKFCSICGEKKSTNLATITDNSNGKNQALSYEHISNIKQYLEHAKTLETNRHTLNTTINRLQDKINTLGIKNQFKEPTSQKEDFLTAFLTVLICGVLLSFFVGYGMMNLHDDLYYFYDPMIIGSIWITLPLSLISGAVSYSKKNNKRQEAYLKEIENDNARVEKEKKQILALQTQQDELRAEITNIEAIMNELYSINVIYPKYREMVPIITMWEYFDSRRCSELFGPNGAYNLYESESRQDIIISNLNKALTMLAQIRDNQYALYEAIQESNDIAERVYRQNESMLESSKNIERNSEIAAYNSKIAAQNSTISAYIDMCRF